MRIEEITHSKLSKVPDKEIYSLRLRFIQLWSKNFQGNDKKKVGNLERNDFLNRYKLLIDEMKKRKLNHSVKDIDRALFRKLIWGIELADFDDVVITPAYISISGSFVKSPTKAKDIDLIVREDEENRDEGMELKLSRLIQNQVKKDCHFIYEKTGPHSSYIPLFDKILRTNSSLQVTEVKEQKAEDKFICECIECGYTIESTEHCKDLKCEECGGQMRRKSRPGYGQKEKSAELSTSDDFHIFSINIHNSEENLPETTSLAGNDIYKAGSDSKLTFSKNLTIGRAFTPLKTSGGYGKLEFADIDALYKYWARGYIPEPGIAIETKFDGFRVTIHKKGNEVKVFSEDAKQDLSESISDVADEVKTITVNCILDGELIIYDGGKKVERKDMPTYLSPNYEGKFTAKIECFDCLYYEDKDLHNETWTERQKYLDKIFGSLDENYLLRVKPTIANTEKEFQDAVEKHSKVEYSEGAMLKVVDSKYPLNGNTSAWAKFKNFKEIRVRVIDKTKKEGGGWIYDCEIQYHTYIGKTYATSINVNKGDILEVAVAEIKYDEEGKKFTWDNPIVRSEKPAGTSLTTISQAKAFARLGRTSKDTDFEKANIDFKENDKGAGVLQIHVMGITEEQIKELDKKAVFGARHDIDKLQKLLLDSIGEHAAHLDFRMLRANDDAWRGGEFQIGNISGLSKLKEFIQHDKKLKMDWKAPHKGEGESENANTLVTGGSAWLKAGEKKVEIFEPGEVGAFANTYAIILQIDKYNFECLQQDTHAKKFIYESKTKSKILDGEVLFAYIPITAAGEKGERIWMASKLKKEKKLFEKYVPIFDISKKEDERIVCGIVYEPDSEDTQGDKASADEIRKAAYGYMEYAQRFKINHKGYDVRVAILESYIAPVDFTINKQKIKKGTWIMTTRILDDTIWKKVKSGELTGYSMAGYASAKETN